MTSESHDPAAGSPPEGLFAGRYRVHEVVGRGGMATVYRAEDALLGRVVALKEMVEPLADNRRGQQLVDEARAAAALSHAHIATVYDTFEEQGRRYIVMEYVGGGSLREILDRNGGRLDHDTAVDIAYEVADALDYAHRFGIIHSDVKPQNILLDQQGHAKLVDFGIARAASQTWALATTVMGSAAYLAPEQVEGGRADPRSDIYSLGLVLYEMLTGRLPFEAGTTAALAAQRLVRDPVPVRIYAPDVPRGLESIVMRCIARDADERYATAWDLGAALDVYREGDRTEALPAMAAVGAPPRPRGGSGDSGGSWRARLLLIAVALLAFTVAAAFVPVLLDGLSDSGGGRGSPGGTSTVAPTATPTPQPTATTQPAGSPTPTPTVVNPFAATATATPTRTPAATPSPARTPSPSPTPFPEAGRPAPP